MMFRISYHIHWGERFGFISFMHAYFSKCAILFFFFFTVLFFFFWVPFLQAQSNNDEDMHDYGRLFVSASHFERSAITNLQRDVESESDIDRDVGFWFGLHPEGVMNSVKSLLPISVVPKSLDNDLIAMEVLVKNGKKHAIFRGLVAVVNDSDVKLDVSLCPLSCIDDRNYTLGTSSRNTVTKQPATFIKDDLIVLSPGTSTVLPWRCTSKDTDQCLQVRPVIDHQPPYTWGCNVAIGSSLIYGKDTPLMDQVPIHRQTTLKQGSKMPTNFTFRLSQLEKKDLLICCSNRTGSKQIWLSAGADASVLQTELNTPVYDWRISINSPLKLENRLPCRAEFTVWEKMREGSFIERQHGVFSSRSSAHIYSADVQRPLYLTLFIEGGWVLEKVLNQFKLYLLFSLPYHLIQTSLLMIIICCRTLFLFWIFVRMITFHHSGCSTSKVRGEITFYFILLLLLFFFCV